MRGIARAGQKPRGLAKARRGATLRRGIKEETISRELEEVLFEFAEVMSEGDPSESTAMHGTFFGSTMITFDLDAVASRYRGDLDGPARRRLLRAVDGSVRVRLRAMRLACAAVQERLPGHVLGTAQVEMRTRLVRGKLHLDVDLEVPFDVSSKQDQR